MTETITSAVTWNDVVHAYERTLELRRKTEDEEMSYAQFRGLVENIPEYLINERGVYVYNEKNEEVEVQIADPENIVMWINVYHVERCYGGGEEGGWWYDWAECEVSSLMIPTEGVNPWGYFQRELEKFKKRFSNEGRRPLSSVLSDGQYDVRVEMTKGESASRRTPHYC